VEDQNENSRTITRRELIATGSVAVAGLAMGIGANSGAAAAADTPKPTEPAGQQKFKLPMGPTAGLSVSGTNSRGQYFCGVAAMVGTPPKDALLYMSYPVTTYAPADLHTRIDTKKLGEELGVPVGVNAARFVTCDEMSYLSSEIVSFHGVRCAWVETMAVAEMQHALHNNDYKPVTGNRYTKFVYKAGKPIYLLRQPDGKCWVMQDAGSEVIKELNPDSLHLLDQVGQYNKNLPAGWKWERKVITRDLVLDTCLSGGYIQFLRDEASCAYQAVGFDNSANYIP
jgi:hypothetical protein